MSANVQLTTLGRRDKANARLGRTDVACSEVKWRMVLNGRLALVTAASSAPSRQFALLFCLV